MALEPAVSLTGIYYLGALRAAEEITRKAQLSFLDMSAIRAGLAKTGHSLVPLIWELDRDSVARLCPPVGDWLSDLAAGAERQPRERWADRLVERERNILERNDGLPGLAIDLGSRPLRTLGVFCRAVRVELGPDRGTNTIGVVGAADSARAFGAVGTATLIARRLVVAHGLNTASSSCVRK